MTFALQQAKEDRVLKHIPNALEVADKPTSRFLTHDMQTLPQYLARQLLNGTRKKFSSLMADYQELQMSKEIRATNHGENSSGPMTDQKAMGVTSQVSVTVPLPQRGVDHTVDNESMDTNVTNTGKQPDGTL